MELLHLLASLQILSWLVSPAAPPQTPTVIMDPQQPVYVPGERLTLRCSAPGGEAVTSYQFYNPRGERVFTETTGLPGGPWLVLTAETGKTGMYSCEYQAVRDGQTIYSARSQPVWISVMDFPLAPSISVISDPPGKSPVTIVCSAPPAHVTKRYQFLRQGNVIVSQPGARLQLRQSDLDATSPYTCSYEISVSGRMIQSLPSAPLSIHLTGVPLPPLAPQINLDLPKNIYFQGERVNLTCSVPGNEQVKGYRFYHQRGEQISELDEGAWLERTAMTGNAGAYSCAYWIIRSGQAILSGKSNYVSITVTAPPLAPKLSLHPKLPVYLPGEKVTLNCSAPRGEEVAGFRFHQHRGDQTPEELPAASGGPWMELTAQRGNDGTYTCQYWRWEEIASKNSNSITVPVSDPPPQPELNVDPPSGAVSEGLPLLMACMAPKDTSEWRFHFYKDGVDVIAGDMGSEITAMEPGTGSLHVSVLSIPRAGPESTGEFTCGYEENMSGRWIPSPRSRAVNITVTAKASPGSIHDWPPWIPLVAGCVGAVVLLPLLLLLICLCRRRKGGVMAETQPVYVNRPSGAGTALQQWNREGQVQPVTHNQPVLLNIPGGKPIVGRNPQERGKREEDADARATITVYSMVTPPSAVAQQRGGKYISEDEVYSKILY